MKIKIAIAMAVMVAATGASAHVTLMTGKGRAGLFAQCSRPVPETGKFKKATLAEAQRLEKAVANRTQDGSSIPRFRDVLEIESRYDVQVTAVERGGRRYVYGNFVPSRKGVRTSETQPSIVCDGGHQFFGAEIDATTGVLTHIAGNGRV